MNMNTNNINKLNSFRFQVQLVDHCNLNCINCLRYSPIAKKSFYSIDSYYRDIKRLSYLTNRNAKSILLGGGEPLLHPNINHFICVTREYFPDAYITIVTNGIKLLSMDDAFFENCKNNNITIAASEYPLKIDYNKIENEMNKKGISYSSFSKGPKIGMNRFLIDPSGTMDGNFNFYNCWKANNCIQLYNGKLYTCDIPCYIHTANEKFNLHLDIEDSNGIDIYRENDINTILNKLTKPIPFCKYCDSSNSDKYFDDWKRSKSWKYEWVKFIWSQEDIDYLKSCNKIFVFGAGKYGEETVARLVENNIIPESVLVTDSNSNVTSLMNIPVVGIKQINNVCKNDVCIIAVKGLAKCKIQHELYCCGFEYLIPLY